MKSLNGMDRAHCAIKTKIFLDITQQVDPTIAAWYFYGSCLASIRGIIFIT